MRAPSTEGGTDLRPHLPCPPREQLRQNLVQSWEEAETPSALTFHLTDILQPLTALAGPGPFPAHGSLSLESQPSGKGLMGKRDPRESGAIGVSTWSRRAVRVLAVSQTSITVAPARWPMTFGVTPLHDSSSHPGAERAWERERSGLSRPGTPGLPSAPLPLVPACPLLAAGGILERVPWALPVRLAAVPGGQASEAGPWLPAPQGRTPARGVAGTNSCLPHAGRGLCWCLRIPLRGAAPR